MLSNYQLQMENNSCFLGKNEKLSTNLGNKQKSKLHYQNKKLHLKLQLEFRKFYRVLRFKQKSFLKPYIERYAEFQREAEQEGKKVKKQIAKLKNRAIFCKSIENPMNKIM